MKNLVKKFRCWFNSRTRVGQVVLTVLFSPVLVFGYFIYMVLWMYVLMPLDIIRTVLSGKAEE